MKCSNGILDKQKRAELKGNGMNLSQDDEGYEKFAALLTLQITPTCKPATAFLGLPLPDIRIKTSIDYF
jgi:hypothetical protein